MTNFTTPYGEKPALRMAARDSQDSADAFPGPRVGSESPARPTAPDSPCLRDLIDLAHRVKQATGRRYLILRDCDAWEATKHLSAGPILTTLQGMEPQDPEGTEMMPETEIEGQSVACFKQVSLTDGTPLERTVYTINAAPNGDELPLWLAAGVLHRSARLHAYTDPIDPQDEAAGLDEYVYECLSPFIDAASGADYDAWCRMPDGERWEPRAGWQTQAE